MAFRFWRRFKVAPGVTLNFSKSGGSFSFGPRGAKLTVGSRGKRATVGLPGTGLFYTTTFPKGRSGTKPSRNATVPAPPPESIEDRLNPSFSQRMTMPEDEKALVDGLLELGRGNERQAFDYLKQAAQHADAAFVAGFLALKQERFQDAGRYLYAAAKNHGQLGRVFAKYGLTLTLSVPVTEEIHAHVTPSQRGAWLGLVEVFQNLKRWKDALACLEKLRRLEPDDVLIKLSLAELLLEARPGDNAVCKRVVRLANEVNNDSEVHAALLLYKARALRTLGLHTAARQTLTNALRKTRERSDTLLRALRYERVLTYEELGQANRARKELEKLYTEAPDYEDVAARLGL